VTLALEDVLIAIQSWQEALPRCLSRFDGRRDSCRMAALPTAAHNEPGHTAACCYGRAGSAVYRSVQAGNVEFVAEVIPQVLAR